MVLFVDTNRIALPMSKISRQKEKKLVCFKTLETKIVYIIVF